MEDHTINKQRRKIYSLFFLIMIYGCMQQNPNEQTSASSENLANQIEELREQYRPGLGEIMGGIQMHHAKLWYAAINNNWKLADYEIAEIKERIKEAEKIETNRPEMNTISMIYPAIDSVTNSIKQQNLSVFKSNFQLLTNTCNECHASNHFEFNVITIPTAPPVYNQDFRIK